jgi:hypothetical protein
MVSDSQNSKADLMEVTNPVSKSGTLNRP